MVSPDDANIAVIVTNPAAATTNTNTETIRNIAIGIAKAEALTTTNAAFLAHAVVGPQRVQFAPFRVRCCPRHGPR